VLYGIDVSNYQNTIDMSAVRREGFDFAFIKSSEGASYRSPAFERQLDGARAAGLLVAAYHYQWADDVRGQLDTITATVPLDVPVILDVEQNGGDVSTTRALLDGLWSRGYHTPLLYLPRWYWQQIGSPDLSGLPPLWSSRYPSMTAAPASVLYQAVDETYWAGYGGLGVQVLQFASTAQVAGHSVDANAYGGDRGQLENVLGSGGIDLQPDERDALFDIREQLTGSRDSTNGGQYPGFDVWDGTGRKLTITDMAREIHRESNQRIGSRVPGSTVTETVLGFAANADAASYNGLQLLITLAAKVDAMTSAMQQAHESGSVDLDAVRKAAEDGIRDGLSKLPITVTGTASIGGQA
jgi:hypothetical protein